VLSALTLPVLLALTPFMVDYRQQSSGSTSCGQF
jgi:hypothetical protein